MTSQVTLLVTSPRLPPGQLSWTGWQALRSGPVLVGDDSHPQTVALQSAGVELRLCRGTPAEQAMALTQTAADGPAVWLLAPDGDIDMAAALVAGGVEFEVVYGSVDPPGARLLDVVAVMDRLRSPGGCPWDAEQTHESLSRYLLDEAYEAIDAIAAGDLQELREELGDVLLQVAFHARLAEERDDGSEWSIDDVAGDLVDKLVRRHPHVFAGRTVSGAEEVVANWAEIKKSEKSRPSVTDGIPLGQPALTLASSLLGRATKAGLDMEALGPEPAPGRSEEAGVGQALLALVADARSRGVDPEQALRVAALAMRERIRDHEEV